MKRFLTLIGLSSTPLIALIGGIGTVHSDAQTVWVAYNDSVDTEPGSAPGHVTDFGLGRGYSGEGDTGNLVDFETGEDTGVTVSFVETTSRGNTINWAGDVAELDAGTAADEEFGGILNVSGNMSYNDAPDWNLEMIVSGLDPELEYTYVGTANRNGGPSYADRVTLWRIIGAEAFTYAAPEGAQKIDDDAVEFSTGWNTQGFVAKWTHIKPGADGTLTIRTTHSVGEDLGGIPGAHSYKGYGGGVFKILAMAESGDIVDTSTLEVFRLTPSDSAQNTHPNTPVGAIIRHRSQAVNPDSVVLKVDGISVNPVITLKPDQTVVTFSSAGMMESSSSHTAALTFEDDGNPVESFERTWTFQTIDYSDDLLYPSIPASSSVPSDFIDLKNGERGIAIRVAAPDPGSGIAVSSIDEAMAIWDLEFTDTTDTSQFNSLGFRIERETINYQTNGEPRGNKANERLFPGIELGNELQVGFALEATGLLYLEPGFYLFNLTMATEYELFIGPSSQEILLPRTYASCTNCGGEDGPWFTSFLIDTAGLYPFRLVYYNGAGQGSLEWLEVSPDGRRNLINADHPDAIAVYAPPETLPIPLKITAIDLPPGQIRIEFFTPEPQKSHTVLLSSNLDENQWIELADVSFQPIADDMIAAVFDRPAGPVAYVQVALIPPAPVFFEDFESGATGWATLNPGGGSTVWQLGAPVDGPRNAFSGEVAYGTDLDGDYAVNTDVQLRSPVVDLADVVSATLVFSNYRDMEPFDGDFFDGGQVRLLDTNGNAIGEPLITKAGTTRSGWTVERVKIPAEALGRQIIIEFRFYADDFQPDDALLDGWYIDDVAIIPE